MNRIKSKFNKRCVIVYGIICICFAFIMARIAAVNNSEIGQRAGAVTEKTVSFGRSRGYIYDRNLVPMVNTDISNTALVVASPANAQIIQKLSGGIGETKSGLLLSFQTETEISEKNLINIKQINRYSENTLCTHIIGYTNYEGRGVCGIEKSFDRLLYNGGGELTVSYSCDAMGRVLMGEPIAVNDREYNSGAGIVLTIDVKIQDIVERLLEKSNIKKGACVVTNSQTGEILACASLPKYKITEIQKSLQRDDAPFLNRALCAYPVGSVFKPFIAAAAMEYGENLDESFECKGYYAVADSEFHCFNRRIHEKENLNDAICNSCNCYFIEYGNRVGGAEIRKTCSAFGFGKEIRLTSDIKSRAGNVPTAEDLKNPAELANLCFGQGKLLASPLQLCAAYSAIANGGVYIEPYITKFLVNDKKEEYAYYAPEQVYKVIDKEICDKLTQSLKMNMLEGTGVRGCSENISSAGKTATAQTGEYDDSNRERLCTWFCGFFPCDFPEYTVCIFNEDGTTASEDCAPIFKELAERISDLYIK